MFQAAGLRPADFAEVPPQWTPQIYADGRMAWEGPMPKRPEVRLRIEAASYRGRPVSFKVVGPWTQPARMDQPQPSGMRRAISLLGSVVVLIAARWRRRCSCGRT